MQPAMTALERAKRNVAMWRKLIGKDLENWSGAELILADLVAEIEAAPKEAICSRCQRAKILEVG